jgi:hypothetical protein
MPLPLLAIGAGLLAAKAGQAYFGNKSKKKKAEDQKKSTTNALTIQQKRSEDARRARLQLGASMMNSVPKTTAGGGVNTNTGIDPELLAQLNIERQYDFGSAVPDGAAGNGSAFVSGLFGAAGDTITGMYGGGMGGGGGTPTSASMLYDRGTGVQLPGGGPQTAPLYGVDESGEVDRGAQPGIGSNISWEDLFAEREGGDY